MKFQRERTTIAYLVPLNAGEAPSKCISGLRAVSHYHLSSCLEDDLEIIVSRFLSDTLYHLIIAGSVVKWTFPDIQALK